MLTVTIDAHENRDVMSADVPNAFIQTEMPEIKQGEDRVKMKITGVLVDILIQLDPQLYGPHVVYERERKVLYVQELQAIYGMLTASLLWYLKFKKDLENIGFKFNENVDVGYQSYSQQYQLGKGLKKFGEKGHKASSSELEQLHHRKCFYPVSVKDMT